MYNKQLKKNARDFSGVEKQNKDLYCNKNLQIQQRIIVRLILINHKALIVRKEYLDTFLLGRIGWEIPETSLLV